MKEKSVDKPWLKRSIWKNGRINNNSLKALLGLVVAFVLICLIATYLIFALTAGFFSSEAEMTFSMGFFNILLQLVFLAFVVFLFIKIVKAWRKWRRWKNCLLVLNPMPAFLGETLLGTLEIPADINGARFLHSTLGCYRKRRASNTRRLHSQRKSNLWKSEKQRVSIITGMRSIPVQFDLPKSRPESSWQNPRKRIFWMLSVTLEKEKIDYEVPVFFNPYFTK